MAEKELPDEGPSLEMPTLGSLFKRRRKKPAAVSGNGSTVAPDAPEVGAGASPRRQEPRAAGGRRPADVDAPSAEDFERLVRGESAAGADAPELRHAEVAPTGSQPEDETEVLPEHDLIAEAEEPALADLEEDDPAPAAEATTAITTPAGESADGSHPATSTPAEGASADTTDHAPTATVAVEEATPRVRPRAGAAGDAARAPVEQTDLVDETDGGARGPESDATATSDEAATVAPRRSLGDISLPTLPAAAAAAVTGAIVGLLAVGLTYFGMQGCEAIKGTSACGGPGIPILVLIMVILVVVGSVLLSAWRVVDPTSTSFLAVGLLAVIALLFLIEVIFSPAMLVVIPLVSVGTYCLSQWVTDRFIDEE